MRFLKEKAFFFAIRDEREKKSVLEQIVVEVHKR